MRANAPDRIAWAVAVTLSLSACARSFPDQTATMTHPKAIAARVVIAQKAPGSASKASMAPMTPYRESDQAAQPPWLAELLNDPDPQVRLQGLEAWSRHPAETRGPR